MAKATAAMLVALAALVAVAASSAPQCDVSQLTVCVPAVIDGSPPTAPCCSNLKAQQPCFCQYAHDPAYSNYINSPNAHATLKSCGIAIPSC